MATLVGINREYSNLQWNTYIAVYLIAKVMEGTPVIKESISIFFQRIVIVQSCEL